MSIFVSSWKKIGLSIFFDIVMLIPLALLLYSLSGAKLIDRDKGQTFVIIILVVMLLKFFIFIAITLKSLKLKNIKYTVFGIVYLLLSGVYLYGIAFMAMLYYGAIGVTLDGK